MMDITRYANPGILWLLTALLPLIAYYVYRTLQGGAYIQVSTTSGIAGTNKTLKYYLRHLPFVLRCMALACLIVALARPQSSEYGSSVTTEGIDIVLAIDVSGSMLARDFQPDRITAARDVASKFIVDRTNDRIGIVIFAGESFTQSPLTTDKKTLLNVMQRVKSGIVEDGTAIGSGLATSINRLRESDAASKVIILLTDGVNNMGEITPLTAADIATTLGIRVYTIGVGTIGTAPYPARDMFGNMRYVQVPVEIDEDVLRKIASQTGGEYFRATDNNSLQAVYDRINELEKSRIETNEYTRYNELFMRFVIAGAILLMLEFLLRHLWLRRIP